MIDVTVGGECKNVMTTSFCALRVCDVDGMWGLTERAWVRERK